MVANFKEFVDNLIHNIYLAKITSTEMFLLLDDYWDKVYQPYLGLLYF